QRLQTSLAGLPSTAGNLPIAPFKGDLEWPVAGTIGQRFGSAIAGRPPLAGVEIESTQGAVVRAVHDGIVAYADAFTGYGRLVIVDHGNQTFTLYGNLADISTTKGASIERGGLVGTVGLGDA